MSSESSLLINNHFALRQVKGKPVYTEFASIKKSLSEQEIKSRIKNLRKALGIDHIMDKNARIRAKAKFHKYEDAIRNRQKSEEVKTNHQIDLSKLQRIIITHNAPGYISADFFKFLKQHTIPIYWIDSSGLIEASFIPTHYVKQSLVMKQCKAVLTGKNIEIAKYLVGLKIIGESNKDLLPKLEKAKTIKNIIAVEGESSRNYMDRWEFDDIWRWKGRHGKNPMSNMYALDPINSLLNLGYSVLSRRMSEILTKRGFELSIGFLHHGEEHTIYWNRLSQDFIEPYRILIDDTTKEIASYKEIKPLEDFTFSKDKMCMVLKDKALKPVLNRFFDKLKPLEHRSLPVIRQVEGML